MFPLEIHQDAFLIQCVFCFRSGYPRSKLRVYYARPNTARKRAGRKNVLYADSPQAAGQTCEMYKYRSRRNSRVVRDLNQFKEQSDIILANRWAGDLKDVVEKAYTQRLFRVD